MPIDRVDIGKICDYVPLASTVTNLSDLFVKAQIEREKNHPSEAKGLDSRYITYVDHKPWFRCVILLFPVVGNLLVAIYDLGKKLFSSKQSKDYEVNAAKFTKLNKIGYKAKFLERMGFTEPLIGNQARFLVDKLAHTISTSTIRGEANMTGETDTEVLEKLRNAPVSDIKWYVFRFANSPIHETFVMFLLLDPRLTALDPKQKSVSDIAQKMVNADPSLKARLDPFIIT